MFKKNLYRLFLLLLLILIVPLSAQAKDVYEYNLRNGLKIFVKVDARAPVVSSQIWYEVGSGYEPEGLTGISHVLEHMMFQGTKRYPKGVLTQLIAVHGGVQNAMTTRDYTMYYEELPAADLALSFKLEADRMQYLLLNQKHFEKELEVIKEERRLRTDNNPIELTYENFYNTAFVGTPYQHPIIGWMKDIASFKLSDVQKWYDQWYVPNNAFVVVVGDVNPIQVYWLAKKYFGDIPAKKLPTLQKVIERKAISNQEIIQHSRSATPLSLYSVFKKYFNPEPVSITQTEKSNAQVQQMSSQEVVVKAYAKLPFIIMGYKVPVLNSTNDLWQAYALMEISAIFDAGSSSRFSKDLVRGNQVAATAGAFYPLYGRLPDAFLITGIPGAGYSIDSLKKAFLNQITKLQTTLVPQEELERVKTQLIAEKIFMRDSIFLQGMEIGMLESIGLSWRNADTLIQHIEEITPKQIQEVAQQYFIPQNLTMAILKPISTADSQQFE